jgi:hypothetical protein
MCTRVRHLKIERDYYPTNDIDKAWGIDRNKFTDDIVKQLESKFEYKFPTESTVDQKFELSKDWPINCKKDWDFHNRIGKGSFGNVYVVCKDNRCNYVAKVIRLNYALAEQKIINEVAILQYVYDKTIMNPIVSKVYDVYVCNAPNYFGN